MKLNICEKKDGSENQSERVDDISWKGGFASRVKTKQVIV